MAATDTSDRLEFENAIRTLEAQVANVGVHLSLDSLTRAVLSQVSHAGPVRPYASLLALSLVAP